MAEPTVFIMYSRDLDADVYKRQEDFVHYWMHTTKTLHSMHSHHPHNVETLRVMWCYHTANGLTRAINQLLLKNTGRRSNTSETKKIDNQIVF